MVEWNGKEVKGMSSEKNVTSEVIVCGTADDEFIELLASAFAPIVMKKLKEKEDPA